MPPTRWLVIVNPAAGGGRCGARAPSALDALRHPGLELTVRATAAPGEATKLATEGWATGIRGFVAAGGDGTAFEVLNGILPQVLSAKERAALGFLPLGTGNSFVRDFTDHTSAAEDYCLQALRERRARPSDVLRVRHASGTLFAISVVSLVFPARVAALVNRRLKGLGKLGYSLGVIAEVIRLAPMELCLSCDGRDFSREKLVLLSLNNNRHVGGDMRMAPEAAIDDGRADLVLAAPVGRLELLRWFPRIFRGTHVSHPAIRVSKVKRVGFDLARAVEVMIDGESQCLQLETVEVVPRAIDVML